MMWHLYGICKCGEHHYLPSGKIFFYNSEVCPTCGAWKYDWKVRSARLVSEAIWYKPSTWGKCHWQYTGGEYDCHGHRIG